MPLSQHKHNFPIISQQTSNDFTTNSLTHLKANVLPPKISRVSSVSSNLYSYDSVQSLSQQSRPARNFSKNKGYVQLFAQPEKGSFNLLGTDTLQNKDCFHRYSCNLGIENKNSFLKNNEKMNVLIDRRQQSHLQIRVRALQEKMRKNEENFKHYNEEIDNFKLQLSSSSLNLLDSINTNILTNSIKDPLRQTPNHQIFNNKQNSEKNTLSFQKMKNPLNELQIEKKTNQIQLIKKQIKRISSKEQNLKTHVKLFHDSMKDMLKSFKDHLERSLQNLIKRQDKNKKKIFEDVNEKIRQKIKEIQNSNCQYLKNALQNLESSQKSKNQCKNIRVGKQRFIGDSLLMKVREEVFIQMIKRPQLDPFTSYVEMIKKSLTNNDSGQQLNLGGITNQLNPDTGLIEKVIIQQVETTYFLDLQGYLLDSQGYYLMDEDQKIKLTPSQLQKLQQHRILQNLLTR